MAKIIRVNLSNLSMKSEPVPERYNMLGGRGLTSTIIYNEVNPITHPLSEGNKLVFAPGVLTGTTAPSSGRLSVGAKSPLTGGIKESNVGGTAARKMANLGIKGLVLEGKAQDKNKYILKISSTGLELLPAEDIWGLGNYDIGEHLRERFGNKVCVLSIGQAGIHQMASATIAVTDMDGRPCRHAGRGGLGAVMGSKGLKAIILDDTQAKESLLDIEDKEGFNAVARNWSKSVMESRKGLTAYGTAVTLGMANTVGGLPTRNFSRGNFEGADKINGTALAERIKANGGKNGHACSPGCVIRCSNIYFGPGGTYVTAGLEYETICLLGSNCEIDDLDAIAHFDYMCDDFGLDTMEIGCALAVAMEGGVLEFGDVARVNEIIKEIGHATVLGRVLGQGAVVTGRVFNVERVPAVKGQSMASYDPRVFKGTGVSYATTPMGGDHSVGNLLPGRFGVDHTKADGQVEASRLIQLCSTVQDTMGLCNFTGCDLAAMDIIAQLLSKATGTELTGADVMKTGQAILQKELMFNQRAGFTSKDDTLPAFFRTEKLAPTGLVFDVSDEDLENIFNFS